MSERLPVANAMANRCSASSSFRIALWKNRKIKIGDSGLEHFKPPLRAEEESTLLTEFGSTATPPPSNGDAMRVLTFFFVISFLFSREIASEFKWLSTLSSSLLCMFLRNQLWVLYVVYPVEAWTVPERESGWREEKRREREFLSLNLFVVKRRRRGRLVWFGLVTTPIRKRTYEREYEGGPRFYTWVHATWLHMPRWMTMYFLMNKS